MVAKTFHKINPQKAAGLDNILGQVLGNCSSAIVNVFADTGLYGPTAQVITGTALQALDSL